MHCVCVRSYVLLADVAFCAQHGSWAFRTSHVDSLYVDAHKPSTGAGRANLSLQCASNIKSLPKHPHT